MTLIKSLILVSLTVAAIAAMNRVEAQSPSHSPVVTVQKLYRDYAWELLFWPVPANWRVLENEPREVLAKYFDDRLTRLILNDRDCVSRSGEECNIDRSPIWNSNDPEASDLEVAATNDSTLVQVSFRRRYPPPQGTKVTLHYRMIHTSKGWRIADIINGDASFVAQLQTK